MRRMLGIMALTAAVPAAAVTPEPAPAMPDWMGGCWVEQGERWTEECWMAPRGGNMLGASRSGHGERVAETENLRIDAQVPTADGKVFPMTYNAAQRSGGWTTFVWTSSDEPGITFVNPQHDYPQRIRYWREGPALLAEISLLDGTKARRWTYQRAAGQ